MRVKVGVNGYGTIGKRVADAIALQDDMELVGVIKTRPDYLALLALRKGYDLYAPADRIEVFEKNGVKVKGAIEDLLGKIDVIIDATPAKIGAKYKPLYVERGVKAIFQGGEKADVAEVSFSTLCNYSEALGKNYVRVVSCNTTGLLRSICVLNKSVGVEKVRATIVRRGADPKEVKKGPINAIVADPPTLPSHHGVDVKSVLPWLDIETAAVAVPTTLMHLHVVNMKLKSNVTREDVIRVFENAPRIMLVSTESLGVKSTAEVIEMARDAGRQRYDIPELVVLEDSIYVKGDELIYFQMVHQESIVVPENIDAIRAVYSLAGTAEETIKKTDRSLGISKKLW